MKMEYHFLREEKHVAHLALFFLRLGAELMFNLFQVPHFNTELGSNILNIHIMTNLMDLLGNKWKEGD